MKGVMKMTKFKKMTTLLLALGILALGSAFATAGTPGKPALPDEIVAAIDSGAVITFYDADGNALWSSDGEVAFDPALLEQVAEVVIADADGNVIEDLPVVTGPGGKLVVQVDDGYLGLGILLKEAGITGVAPADGSGMQNQEQHQYKEQHQEKHQTKGDCEDGGQYKSTDNAAHHASGKTAADDGN